MSFLQGAPVPKDPIAGNLPVTWKWVQWLVAFVNRIDQAPQLKAQQDATAATDTILSTPLTTGPLPAGDYFLSYYARITTAAATTSSLAVTLGWTDGFVPCTRTFPAETGNTTATTTSAVIPIHISANAPITYATTYSANPANSMTYSLNVMLQAAGTT